MCRRIGKVWTGHKERDKGDAGTLWRLKNREGMRFGGGKDVGRSECSNKGRMDLTEGRSRVQMGAGRERGKSKN